MEAQQSAAPPPPTSHKGTPLVLARGEGVEYRVFDRADKERTKDAIIAVWGSEHPFYKFECREVLEYLAESATEEALRLPSRAVSVVAVDDASREVVSFVLTADFSTLKRMNPPGDTMFDRLRAYNQFEQELEAPFWQAQVSIKGIIHVTNLFKFLTPCAVFYLCCSLHNRRDMAGRSVRRS